MIRAGLLEYVVLLPETAVASLRRVFHQVDADRSTVLIIGAVLVLGVYLAFRR